MANGGNSNRDSGGASGRGSGRGPSSRPSRKPSEQKPLTNDQTEKPPDDKPTGERPERPGRPGRPATPDKPTRPGRPTIPDKPTTPDKPTGPVKPTPSPKPEPGFVELIPGAKAQPGQVAGVLTVDDEAVTETVRRTAFAGCFGAEARFQPNRGCVWILGDSELGVRPGQLKVERSPGRFDVAVPIFSDQTGQLDITVVLIVGSPASPTGLLAATESMPIGLPANLARWRESIIAFAWRSVHDGLARLAAAESPAIGDEAAVPITLEVGELTTLRVGRQVPFRAPASAKPTSTRVIRGRR